MGSELKVPLGSDSRCVYCDLKYFYDPKINSFRPGVQCWARRAHAYDRPHMFYLTEWTGCHFKTCDWSKKCDRYQKENKYGRIYRDKWNYITNHTWDDRKVLNGTSKIHQSWNLATVLPACLHNLSDGEEFHETCILRSWGAVDLSTATAYVVWGLTRMNHRICPCFLH